MKHTNKIAKGIDTGANTIHHDHVTTPVNLSTTNTIANTSNTPNRNPCLLSFFF